MSTVNSIDWTDPLSLHHLRAGNNSLTGPIPDVIGPASSLQVLSLAGNGLTGTIPSSIGNAAQLISLDIGGNNVSGTIPASLGSISTLKYAAMPFNQLTGAQQQQRPLAACSCCQLLG